MVGEVRIDNVKIGKSSCKKWSDSRNKSMVQHVYPARGRKMQNRTPGHSIDDIHRSNKDSFHKTANYSTLILKRHI